MNALSNTHCRAQGHVLVTPDHLHPALKPEGENFSIKSNPDFPHINDRCLALYMQFTKDRNCLACSLTYNIISGHLLYTWPKCPRDKYLEAILLSPNKPPEKHGPAGFAITNEFTMEDIQVIAQIFQENPYRTNTSTITWLRKRTKYERRVEQFLGKYAPFISEQL